MALFRSYRTSDRHELFAAVVVSGLTIATLPALAHHGWDWAQAEQTEMKGTVEKVSMAPPHPSMQVKMSDGAVWQVDLANPNQTQRAGFTAKSAKSGDSIVILGNRHKDQSKRVIKAVRVTVGGKTYDLYPERIGAR